MKKSGMALAVFSFPSTSNPIISENYNVLMIWRVNCFSVDSGRANPY
jgi:hypothetical protein